MRYLPPRDDGGWHLVEITSDRGKKREAGSRPVSPGSGFGRIDQTARRFLRCSEGDSPVHARKALVGRATGPARRRSPTLPRDSRADPHPSAEGGAGTPQGRHRSALERLLLAGPPLSEDGDLRADLQRVLCGRCLVLGRANEADEELAKGLRVGRCLDEG